MLAVAEQNFFLLLSFFLFHNLPPFLFPVPLSIAPMTFQLILREISASQQVLIMLISVYGDIIVVNL